MRDPKLPLHSAGAALLLVLPWLNPVTYGPTHAVVQFLTVWVAAAFSWLLLAQVQQQAASNVALLASAWLLAACASACMGLLQYLGLADAFSPWINYVEAGQAYANLRQRNQQATLLAIGVCALLWWQARCTGAGASGRPAQASVLARRTAWAAWGFAAILLASADAASGSRTGLLQVLLLSAWAVLWGRGRASLLLVLLTYAAAAVVLPRLAHLDPLHSGILGRLGEASPGCASRLTLWSNVLHLIAQKPWTGWGWGELDYAHFMTLYDGPRFCEILGNAHNLPLHLAVELGIPFAVLVCGTALWFVWRAQPWREQDATRQMAWSVLAVIGLHSLLEYPLWYGPFQLAALLAVWLLWQTPSLRPGVQASASPTSARARSSLATRWQTGLACAVLLACVYAGWDYWRISQIYLPVAQRHPAYRDNTLEKIRASWLFADQVKFAELGTTPLTRDNAEHVHALALQMLHFSPEASVVTQVIESAELLDFSDEAQAYKTRFAAAYPAEYSTWRGKKDQDRSGARHKTP